MTLTPLSDGRPGLRALLPVQIREAAADLPPSASTPQPVLEFIASNATLDRYHEIIEPAGWRLDNYRRNPVFLNSHNYGDIIYTIGKALRTEVRDGALRQQIQFATDANPLARIAYGLYREGFLSAVSVGFIPLRWENGDTKSLPLEGRVPRDQLDPSALPSTPPSAQPAQVETVPLGPSGCVGEIQVEAAPLGSPALDPSTPTLKSQPYRRRYLEQELIEVSAVTVPANPDALQLTLKSGAFTRADLAAAADMLNCYVRILQPSTFNPQPVLRLARLLHQAMRL